MNFLILPKSAIIIIQRNQDSYLMTWIFDQCTMYQGQCIRSYIAFGLATFVCLFSLLACIMKCRQTKSQGFQQLTLNINLITSVCLMAFYSQNQKLNIRLILFLIEIYSYFLLSFGFIFNVLRKSIKNRQGGIKHQKRYGWMIFGLATILSLVLIIMLTILTSLDYLNCSLDKQIGLIIVLAVEVPLTISTFLLISKAKVALASIFHNTSQQDQGNVDNNRISQVTHHLLDGEDQNKKINYKQVNVVKFAFITSLALHTVQLVSIYLNNNEDQIYCNNETNRLQINGALGLYTASIESISQLFPHIVIPIIFWYMTSTPQLTGQTLYLKKQSEHKTKEAIEKKQIQKSSLSNLKDEVRNQENIRDKISRGRLQSYQAH